MGKCEVHRHNNTTFTNTMKGITQCNMRSKRSIGLQLTDGRKPNAECRLSAQAICPAHFSSYIAFMYMYTFPEGASSSAK